jgi:CrcB protein
VDSGPLTPGRPVSPPYPPVDPDLAPDDPAQPSAAHHHVTPHLHRAHPRILAAIAAGGALGAPVRYGVAQLVHTANDGFPWATFWTNVSGSLALGGLIVLVIRRYPPRRYLRPFAATGFLGAFTTFSTYAVETDLLAKDGHLLRAAAYLVASALAGVAAASAGIVIASRATRATSP